MPRGHRLDTRQRTQWCVGLAITLGATGCAQTEGRRRYDALLSELRRTEPTQAEAKAASEELERPDSAEKLDLTRENHLGRDALIETVLARNPSVQSARQGWRAALAQYPQVTTLDDPMLEYTFAPLSIDPSVPFGQSATISQRLPWPGKLALQGEVALAEAEAARADFRSTRLRLALMASLLFDQYYAVARSEELNEEHRKLIERIQAAVLAQYESGRASQQEILQAELERSHVLHQDVILEARRVVIVAQINGLLHRPVESPLPPPPAELEVDLGELEKSDALQALAIQERPELQARRAIIEGRESSIALARRQFYPDFGLMTSYNSMWGHWQHQWMAGVSLNLPIQIRARRAAVEEARARHRQSQFDLAAQTDDIRVEVDSTRRQLIEAQHVVRLYREKLIPTARAQIEAARLAYESGSGNFQALIDAERSLRSLEIRYEEALATLSQRRAELARVVGRIPGLSREGQKR